MRYKIDRNHKITSFLCLLLGMILLTGSMCIPVYAAEYWPEGPEVVSPNVIVMEASTGTVLYDCDSLEAHYPASITKIMTTLIALENSDLNDIVTFSDAAIDNTEGSGIARDYGEQMTMEQCLYAVMLASANECAYAVAEHVGGTIENFVAMMNEKAKELGCQNTHFANPHGLNDPNHYTTPHDMALIARAAFANDIVKTVASTRTYTLPATKKNPSGLTVTMGHKMLNPKDSRYYQGIIGGKTGYTSKAGNTLVTAAERNGVRLIAVVMKSQSTHYTDTKALLDYGFKLAEAGALTGQNTSQNTSQAPTPGNSTNNTNSANNANNTNNTNNSSSQETKASAPTQPESADTNTGGPGAVKERGWVKDNNGWYYVKGNGIKAVGEWITDNGETYWIQSDHYMAKGWKELDGKWYYFCSTGSLAKNVWKAGANGIWYYLGQDGVMLTNTTTPDGYKVGADGAWIR